MNEELKPCPFCGSKEVKVFSFSDGGICVRCLNCYCQTAIMSDLCIVDAMKESAFEKITKAWNRRVEYDHID